MGRQNCELFQMLSSESGRAIKKPFKASGLTNMTGRRMGEPFCFPAHKAQRFRYAVTDYLNIYNVKYAFLHLTNYNKGIILYCRKTEIVHVKQKHRMQLLTERNY